MKLKTPTVQCLRRYISDVTKKFNELYLICKTFDDNEEHHNLKLHRVSYITNNEEFGEFVEWAKMWFDSFLDEEDVELDYIGRTSSFYFDTNNLRLKVDELKRMFIWDIYEQIEYTWGTPPYYVIDPMEYFIEFGVFNKLDSEFSNEDLYNSINAISKDIFEEINICVLLTIDYLTDLDEKLNDIIDELNGEIKRINKFVRFLEIVKDKQVLIYDIYKMNKE